MLAEYDFSEGVRGKYASRFALGTNIVVLSPENAKHFPDSDSVNQALEAIIKITHRSRRKKVTA